jgi:hypothetical protein
MAGFERFDHNGAEAVLKGRGLLAEIEEVVKELSFVKPELTPRELPGVMSADEIKKLPEQMALALQKLFSQRGWKREVVLLEETRYRHDTFKNRVLVEIDLRGSSIDSAHRNFLRAQELHNRGLIDVFVQIVEMESEPKFDAMRRDIVAFKSVLKVPIYLIGVGENDG